MEEGYILPTKSQLFLNLEILWGRNRADCEVQNEKKTGGAVSMLTVTGCNVKRLKMEKKIFM